MTITALDTPGIPPRSLHPRNIRTSAAVLLIIEAVLASAALLASMTEDRWGFAAVGIMMAAITHLPFVHKRESVWSMWGVSSFAVTVGAGIRGVLIAIGYPSETFVNEFFLRGATFSTLWSACAIGVFSIGALTLGYVAAKSSRPADRVLSHQSLDLTSITERSVLTLAILYAAVGAAGTFAYLRSVGGLSSSISARRGTVFSDGSTTGTFGYYEFVAKAGVIALMIVVIYWTSTRRSIGLRWILLSVFAVNAFAINWVTTTRADLLYVSFAVLMLVRIIKGRLPLFLVALVGVGVISAIAALTAARSTDPDTPAFSITYGVDSGLLNRNAYDIGKTALIVNAVPEQLPYQDGATIARFFAAPIPRSIWPDKPIISPGPIIGRVLYETTASGVPPGLTGELVWNFGRTASVILAFAIGLVLGWIERAFLPLSPTRAIAMLFYATSVLVLGKNVLGVSIGSAAMTLIGAFVLLLPLIVLSHVSHSRPAKGTA